jgi:diguanylate cyclase (GGDEF)-like protein
MAPGPYSGAGHPDRGSRARVWCLSAGLALAALGLQLVAGGGAVNATAPLGLPWWALAVAFGGTEIAPIHLQFRRQAFSISLSEIPLVLGLVFGTPTGLLLGRLAGSGAALAFHRRQEPMKLAFNLGLFALETRVAVVVYRAILGTHLPVDPVGWAAAFAAALALHLLCAVTVVGAVSLHEDRLQAEMLSQALRTGFVNAVTTTSLALVAATVLWHDVRAAALLGLTGAIFFLLYRGYAALSQRHANLEALYAFTRNVARSLDVEAAIGTMLAEAREMLQAERAEVMLYTPGAGTGALRWSLGSDHDVESGAPDPVALALGDRLVTEGQALLLTRAQGDPVASDQLAELGVREAMVAAIRGESGVVGTMLVVDRLGQVRGYDAEDLKLFETLVNHASVTLENATLVDRLRREAADKEYQALHDPLTGLPNRTLFRRRIDQAVAAARGTDRNVAVMLMDLDRFKEVNDTLGHHNGDLLLQEVSARLTGLLRPGDVVARLGGDEFALLLPSIGTAREAIDVAETLLRALQQPFAQRELTLEIGASIGIALHPDHGSEASTLLQRADVAMYAAKSASCGFEVYAAERDQYSPRRLALVGELRTAIEADALEMHYQPKAEMATGEVVGVEALLRWHHPRHGYLQPDEFIPIAEHTGLMRPLTLLALRTALRQCRDWRARGIELTMAVNLSARSLLDVHLPDDVAHLLGVFEVPGSALTLEITESSIMGDSPRTAAVMSRLNLMGVQFAIDDFGTGYSSLSYLKQLPVDEIKVDRSFVMNMPASESDAKIVGSTVHLGRDLGLRVVAEGVENEELWHRLVALGCDQAQGYFLSRALPSEHFEEWYRARQAAVVSDDPIS